MNHDSVIHKDPDLLKGEEGTPVSFFAFLHLSCIILSIQKFYFDQVFSRKLRCPYPTLIYDIFFKKFQYFKLSEMFFEPDQDTEKAKSPGRRHA